MFRIVPEPHRRSSLLLFGLLTAPLLTCLSAANGDQNSDPPRTFSLKAPNAKGVELCGEWTNKNLRMNRGDDGTWTVSLESVPAGVWGYSFRVDGVNVLDPNNPVVAPQRELKQNLLHIPSTPPSPWDWQNIPHGTIHVHDYQSKALGKRRALVVYTPPGYETDTVKRFPLLVLQHGAGGNHRGWVERGKAHWILDHLIAAKNAVPMIVLMIDGHSDGVFPVGDEKRYAKAMEAFRRELFEDAIPLVEKNYRLAEGRENRAIVGLSMGGRQSLTVGLGTLDRFAWIGAFSSSANLDVLKPVLDTPQETNERLKLLWLACGRDDSFLNRNEAIVETLSNVGIHHQWHLTDGGHNWRVWRNYLTDLAPLLFQR
jgi:enterochelin esterase family protein